MLKDQIRSFWSARRRFVAAAVMVLALFGTTLAFAEEGGPEPAFYWPEDDLIVFSLPGEEDPADCQEAELPPTDGADVEDLDTEETEESTVIETTIPGCFAASTLGPNGQRNHGSVISALNRALKELDYKGGRGQLISHAAKSEWGKEDNGLFDLTELTDESDDDSGDGDGPNGSNGHGRGKQKGKKKK